MTTTTKQEYTLEQKAALIETARLMREGAKLRPQGYHEFFSVVDGVVRSCALGAMYEAKTGALSSSLTDLSVFGLCELDILRTTKVLHPTYGEIHYLEYTVGHLNDYKEWTREAIADWVEGLATNG